MKNIILIAAAPLVLTGCGLDAGNNSTTANTTAAIPDTVEVNGVTYVRARADKPAPSASPAVGLSSAAAPAPSADTGTSPSADTGTSAPPNSGTSGAAADHGQ